MKRPSILRGLGRALDRWLDRPPTIGAPPASPLARHGRELRIDVVLAAAQAVLDARIEPATPQLSGELFVRRQAIVHEPALDRLRAALEALDGDR